MAKRILVVDDEKSIAFLLGETLAQLGPEYQVQTAYSGEEALSKIAAEPFDLVVTDLRMPDISGLELIRRLRPINPFARTILITAYGSDEAEAEARRLGAYRYITKPVKMGEFMEVVQEALLKDLLAA